LFVLPYTRVVPWGIRASRPSVRFVCALRLDGCDNRLDVSLIKGDSSGKENGGCLCDNGTL
jgi:hypothetical protein